MPHDIEVVRQDVHALQQTALIMREATGVFTEIEMCAVEESVRQRKHTIGARERQQTVTRLREVIARRHEVMTRLDATFGLFHRFATETEVIVSTHAQLELDLQTLEAHIGQNLCFVE